MCFPNREHCSGTSLSPRFDISLFLRTFSSCVCSHFSSLWRLPDCGKLPATCPFVSPTGKHCVRYWASSPEVSLEGWVIRWAPTPGSGSSQVRTPPPDGKLTLPSNFAHFYVFCFSPPEPLLPNPCIFFTSQFIPIDIWTSTLSDSYCSFAAQFKTKKHRAHGCVPFRSNVTPDSDDKKTPVTSFHSTPITTID